MPERTIQEEGAAVADADGTPTGAGDRALVEELTIHREWSARRRAIGVAWACAISAAFASLLAAWLAPLTLVALALAAAPAGALGALAAWTLVLAPARREDEALARVTARVERLSSADRESAYEVLLAVEHGHALRPISEAIHDVLIDANAERMAAARLRREMRQKVELEAKRQTAHLHQLCNTDELTRLANRRGFEMNLDRLVDYCRSNRIELALLAIDLDHFKRLNDTCGHTKGDEALTIAGELLIAHTRHNDLAGRLGGDELMLALCGVSEHEAVLIADRLIQLFRNHPAGAPAEIPWPSMSVGLAFLLADGAGGPEELREFADEALYASKHGGRSQVQRYRPAA
jgi:diguanylate cyclase (GGDEF)-like protein